MYRKRNCIISTTVQCLVDALQLNAIIIDVAHKSLAKVANEEQKAAGLYLITGKVLANKHRVTPYGGYNLHVANRSDGCMLHFASDCPER